jgi:hypothetical protein
MEMRQITAEPTSIMSSACFLCNLDSTPYRETVIESSMSTRYRQKIFPIAQPGKYIVK